MSYLNSVIRTAEKFVGTGLPSFEAIYNDRVVKRTANIRKDVTHPGHEFFKFLPSKKRMKTYVGAKRFTDSFYTSAVKIFNNSNS